MDKHVNNLPGQNGFLFFGEALSLLTGKQKFFHDRYKKYGNIVKTKIFNDNYVILYDEKLFVKIIDENQNILSSERGWSFLQPLLGNGILLQDGVKHLRSRRLISSSFRDIDVQYMVDQISNSANLYFSNEFKDGKQVCLYRSLKKFTFYAISSIIFGDISFEEKFLLEKDFFDLLNGQAAPIRLNLPYSRYGKAIKARKKLRSYIHNKLILNDRSFNNSNSIFNSIIKNNCHSSDQLQNDELVDQIFQLLFGGYETVALVLSWMLYILSINPAESKKVSDDISKLINTNNLTLDDLYRLNYIDKFILETIRLFPPVYLLPRGLNESIVVDGYFIDRSSRIIFCPLMYQRNSKIFSNPLDFNPSRFNEISLRKKILSFGHGIHRCLGEELAKIEIKVFLCILLRNYSFFVEPKIPFISALNKSTDLLKSFNLKIKC